MLRLITSKIILFILVLLMCITIPIGMYLLGYRIDALTHKVIFVESTLNSYDCMLTLTEGGVARAYNIPIQEFIYPEDYKNIVFNPKQYRKQVRADANTLVAALQTYFTEVPRTKYVPSSITEDCQYLPTINGNELNLKKFSEDLRQFPQVTTFDLSDYYIKHFDSEAKAKYNLIQKLNSSVIEYTNGSVIKATDMEPQYVVSTNSISFNEALIKDTAKKISLTYDNVGKDKFQFTPTLQEATTITSGTWGCLTDTLAEMDEVTQLVENMSTSVNRVPVLKQDLPNILPNTYIEVDRENQKVFVYEDGVKIMESDCVTGLPPRRTTPAGVYFVSEQRKNKTLTGPGYSSFVNRWMRLTNSGIGLHDATWRSQFGGDIYKHDGSHGCINLPKTFAYELYDWAADKKNLCVVVL